MSGEWHTPSIREFAFQQITLTFDSDERMYNKLRTAATVDGDYRAKGEAVADVIRREVEKAIHVKVIREVVMAVLDLGDGLLVEQLGEHYSSE